MVLLPNTTVVRYLNLNYHNLHVLLYIFPTTTPVPSSQIREFPVTIYWIVYIAYQVTFHVQHIHFVKVTYFDFL